MCGEHWVIDRFSKDKIGSSPHVRGTPDVVNNTASTIRFIPACAGNTERLSPPIRMGTVHPRMCGEHRYIRRVPNESGGSSPHVRGTHHDNHAILKFQRFIPACAGNTLLAQPRNKGRKVHPRMCGEHVHSTQSASNEFGSSPHVRGTPRCRCQRSISRRFIPACAGNTA